MSSMKGLLKGLRYISQIFENEKEEMEIGFPTDVKHVAHIGMDGPSANTPSWMTQFKGNPDGSPMPSNNEAKDKPTPNSSSAQAPMPRDRTQAHNLSDAPADSPTRRVSNKTRPSRRRHSSSGSIGSPTRDPLDSPPKTKQSSKPRRAKNSGELDSPARDPSTRSARHASGSTLSSDSASQDPSGIPKSRRKKSKDTSTGGGSGKSSRPKAVDPLSESFPYSDPGPEQ
ncbi:CRIB domain-containing protein RIC10 [Diospyros lotus]|uniref:CRIB domain-containing protein RIC10 n=1 Tax=Diospyros lotus TaxID=55363 RepID=UPI0022514CC0|nr:CRIB domain-containing protein RIC10 [Diospyros lotus]